VRSQYHEGYALHALRSAEGLLLAGAARYAGTSLKKCPVAKEASAEVVAAIAYANAHHPTWFWDGVGDSALP
jgi:hypothetical protein